MAANDDGAALPSVSFSLAAIVRRRRQRQQLYGPEHYLLVHENPPRGWWLPGGGVEHRDETPVHAAVRETVEEAGSPSLLPLLEGTTSGEDAHRLPYMTHLISLQQSPGRIRFIFRGELMDDGEGGVEGCILKCPPGDEESIEAKWVTYDQVQRFHPNRWAARNNPQSIPLDDPWLRGHEPITFFGMLELCGPNYDGIPGLPVHVSNLSGKQNEHNSDEVTGAFFGRMPGSDDQPKERTGLTYHDRAALITHLQCRLLVYDETRQTFAVDSTTTKFPSSFVNNQEEMTLRQLVDRMVSCFVTQHASKSSSKTRHRVGLLRVEHVIHEDGREATLTAFPFVRLFAIDDALNLDKSVSETLSWVAGEELSDQLERRLADAAIAGQSRKNYYRLDILRDDEGPIVFDNRDVTSDDISGDSGDVNATAHSDPFLEMIRAQNDLRG